MSRLLINAGLRVVGLASPIGATRAIIDNNVNVVVIDVQMPSIRGDRLAALFRGNPRFRSIGVVLVSGEGEMELHRLAAEVAADADVSKARMSELVPAVMRLTRGAPSARGVPRSG